VQLAEGIRVSHLAQVRPHPPDSTCVLPTSTPARQADCTQSELLRRCVACWLPPPHERACCTWPAFICHNDTVQRPCMAWANLTAFAAACGAQQEPQLCDGPTVDENIRPALAGMQALLKEYEEVRAATRSKQPHSAW